MMRRILAALAITGAGMTVGCAAKADHPADRPETTTVVISYDDLLAQNAVTRSVSLHVGDFLQISLGSNSSTGYQWAPQMDISNPKVLVQTGHEALTGGTDKPGAPGSEVWVLQAMAPGEARVSTSYSRPWEGGEKGTWSFTADVTVN